MYVADPVWIQTVLSLLGLVADQGLKGVCWAFAVRLCVSLLVFKEHHDRDILSWKGWLLSVQELVDQIIRLYSDVTSQQWFKWDSHGTYNLPTGIAFYFVKEFGLLYEVSHPYTDGRDEHKSLPMDNEVPRVYIDGFEYFGTYTDESKELIIDAIKNGCTLVANIVVTPEFRSWTDGVYRCTYTEAELAKYDSHAIVVLDVDPDREIALIINSRGVDFGMTDCGGLAEVSLDTLSEIWRPVESWRATDHRLHRCHVQVDQQWRCPDLVAFSPVMLTAKMLTAKGGAYTNQASIAKKPTVSVNRVMWSPDGKLCD